MTGHAVMYDAGRDCECVVVTLQQYVRIPVGHVGLEALLVSAQQFRQHVCWQLQYVLIMTLVACFSVSEDCGTAHCSFTVY